MLYVSNNDSAALSFLLRFFAISLTNSGIYSFLSLSNYNEPTNLDTSNDTKKLTGIKYANNMKYVMNFSRKLTAILIGSAANVI